MSEEKDKNEKQKKNGGDVTRLLPSQKWGYSKAQEVEYYYKTLCHFAVDGNSIEAYRLYNNSSLLEIFEILMIKKAINYE